MLTKMKESNKLNMDTNTFLHTNINEYLAIQEHPVTCISCINCIRPKDKTISYKYPSNMESINTATYRNSNRYKNE